MPKIELEEPTLAGSIKNNEGKAQAMELAEEARQQSDASASFAGQLFLGNFDKDKIFPFPVQSPEEKRIGDEYIEKITTFLYNNLDPDEVDATRQIPKEVIQGLADMGAFALKVPKEYDGLGFSVTNYNRVVMRVSSYCAATGVLLSAHQSIGVPQPIRLFGTEEQKRKYLPRFRKGDISAFALTELDVGSDPARLSSEAKLSSDGSYYTLNGTKLWCTNGTIADVIVVIARTAPKIVHGKEKQQLSAFILEMNSPGVEVLHRCDFMGLKGIYNGLIKFTDVKIPKENLIGEEGQGLKMALATINVGRLTLPAGSLGAAKQCLKIARRWGNDRVQWGMPIGLHEAGREKIAYIAATTFAMEAVMLLTSAWGDQGVDVRIEAAMAKYFATEELWKIADLTMQLRGGRGYETARSLKARGEIPYPVERILRDCRINTILEGTSEIMHLFLSREVMEPHLKRLKPLLSPKTGIFQKIATGGSLLGHYAIWAPAQYFKSFFSHSYKESKSLSKYFSFIESHSHILAYKLFFAMATHRQSLEKRQLILSRLINIGTDLFVMATTCSYAIQREQEHPGSGALELADYFCKMAISRINQRLKTLKHNDDRTLNQLAKNTLNDHYIWLEDGAFPYP